MVRKGRSTLLPKIVRNFESDEPSATKQYEMRNPNPQFSVSRVYNKQDPDRDS
jgi:hypothetical protein